VNRLAGPTEDYAAVRRAISSRTELLSTLVNDGRTSPQAVATAYTGRGDEREISLRATRRLTPIGPTSHQLPIGAVSHRLPIGAAGDLEMPLVPFLVQSLAALYPADVAVSDAPAESLSFTDSRYDGETIVRAGYGAGIVAAASCRCRCC